MYRADISVDYKSVSKARTLFIETGMLYAHRKSTMDLWLLREKEYDSYCGTFDSVTEELKHVNSMTLSEVKLIISLCNKILKNKSH